MNMIGEGTVQVPYPIPHIPSIHAFIYKDTKAFLCKHFVVVFMSTQLVSPAHHVESQDTQDPAPGSENDPVLQGIQVEDPSELHDPAGHSKQALPTEEYLPAAQGVQEVE